MIHNVHITLNARMAYKSEAQTKARTLTGSRF